MKKIVGIFAAAAVLATSVFAADVSAGVRIEGSLFDYSKDSISALTINHNNQFYHAPIAFSISDDKAGGTLKLTDLDGADSPDTVQSRCWSIWFKPDDILKITVGEWTGAMNQEHIDWCNTDSGIGAEDGTYTLSLTPADGVSVDVTTVPGWGKAWMSKAGDADAAIAPLGLLFNYSADFGKISAVFEGKDNFKTLKFGAAYANNFSGFDMFVNVLGFYANDNFAKVRAELWGQYSADALTFQAFIVGGYNLKGGYDYSWWHVGKSGAEGAFVGALLKLSYALDGATAYLYVKSVNFLADPFAIEIKPGVTTNVGLCAIECAADVNLNGSAVTFGIPVNFTVKF